MNRQIRTIKLRTCGIRARIIITDSFDDLMSSFAQYASPQTYKSNCIHTYCENYLDDIIPDLVGKRKVYRKAVFDELFESILVFNPSLKEFLEQSESSGTSDTLPNDVALIPVNIAKITKKQPRKRQSPSRKTVEPKITQQSVKGLSEYLKSRVFGQEEAIEIIQSSLEAALVGLGDPEKPRGSYIFIGDTGTGKTMTVKEIVKFFYGKDWRDAIWTLNGSEYMEEHECAKILGSPAGYVGYEDGSAFLEHMKSNPESIILVDEFEKAHPKLQDIFLQVLDDGSIVDNKGNRVDFSKSFVVFTSNIGTREVFRANPIGFGQRNREYSEAKKSVHSALHKHCRPEFLKRFDGFIVFQQLSSTDMKSIARAEVEVVKSRLEEKKIRLLYTDEAISWLSCQVSDMDTARDMNAIVKHFVTLPISKQLMSGDDYNSFRLSIVDCSLKVKGVKVGGKQQNAKVSG